MQRTTTCKFKRIICPTKYVSLKSLSRLAIGWVSSYVDLQIKVLLPKQRIFIIESIFCFKFPRIFKQIQSQTLAQCMVVSTYMLVV